MFNFGKNSFKNKIKGVFENWHAETPNILVYYQRHYPNHSYRILISEFRDVNFKKPFLALFSKREQKALRFELEKTMKYQKLDSTKRQLIFKEFKLER